MTPMSVAELRSILSEFSPTDVVMISCEDVYYSGPVTAPKIERGVACHFGPYEWQTPPEDHLGRPRPQRTIKSSGGWTTEECDHLPVIEKTPCLVILATR